MNIYYCHGFASRFDASSQKIKTLRQLGPVCGDDLDYTKPADETIQRSIDRLISTDVDIIVGTSMGGWLASIVGARLGIPFVAINPAIEPSQTLRAHVGKGVDFQGKEYELMASVVSGYGSLAQGGCGLILLDEGDDVIDWRKTRAAFHEHYSVVSFPGGSHRFEHMKASLPLIESFLVRSSLVYGAEDDS